uniref:Conserved plasma membrane protein n=1 Tax=Echinostoma caproni TaxID=27848 RepID=A0A183B5R5_9TREM
LKRIKWDAGSIVATVLAVVLVLISILGIIMAIRLVKERRAYQYYTCIDPPEPNTRTQLEALSTWCRASFIGATERQRTRPVRILEEERFRLLDETE